MESKPRPLDFMEKPKGCSLNSMNIYLFIYLLLLLLL